MILLLTKLSNSLVDITLIQISTTRGTGGTTVDPSSKSFHLYDHFDTLTPYILVAEIDNLPLTTIFMARDDADTTDDQW